MVLIFKSHGCTKYANTTLLLLVKVSALLTRSQSFRLIWNRFCNVIVIRGRYIPLHFECDNNFPKVFLKALGANLIEVNTQGIAASLNSGNSDKDCDHKSRIGTVRGGKDPAEKGKQITTNLMKVNVFTKCQQRDRNKGFETFSLNLYVNLNCQKLFNWIKVHLTFGEN